MQRAKSSYKSHVTVSFDLEVPVQAYPAGTTEAEANYLDKLAYTGDTERLLEILCGVEYQIEVVPKG